MKNNLQRGFTLIEVMVVVVIIGLLASIAIPSYFDSVLKGRRAEARAALADLMQQQERYMTQTNTYSGFTTNTSGVATPIEPATTVPFTIFSGNSSAGSAYYLNAIRCDAAAVDDSGSTPFAECVRLAAVPKQPDEKAGILLISSTGEKTCINEDDDNSVCWK